MILTRILRLARSLDVPLASRSVSGTYQYDGETIGIFYQKEIVSSRVLEFYPEYYLIDPFLILHDMAHHLMSLEWCRDLPEWGLYVGLETKLSANGGLDQIKNHKIQEAIVDGLLPVEEQNKQEFEAYILGAHFCHLLDYPIPEKRKGWVEDYYGDKECYLESAAEKSGIGSHALYLSLEWALKQ